MLRKSVFFSILCAFFLNTLCIPESTTLAEEEKFVQPLVLADYDGGTLYTEIGSLSGGDEEKPTVHDVSLREVFARGAPAS